MYFRSNYDRRYIFSIICNTMQGIIFWVHMLSLQSNRYEYICSRIFNRAKVFKCKIWLNVETFGQPAPNWFKCNLKINQDAFSNQWVNWNICWRRLKCNCRHYWQLGYESWKLCKHNDSKLPISVAYNLTFTNLRKIDFFRFKYTAHYIQQEQIETLSFSDVQIRIFRTFDD